MDQQPEQKQNKIKPGDEIQKHILPYSDAWGTIHMMLKMQKERREQLSVFWCVYSYTCRPPEQGWTIQTNTLHSQPINRNEGCFYVKERKRNKKIKGKNMFSIIFLSKVASVHVEQSWAAGQVTAQSAVLCPLWSHVREEEQLKTGAVFTVMLSPGSDGDQCSICSSPPVQNQCLHSQSENVYYARFTICNIMLFL